MEVLLTFLEMVEACITNSVLLPTLVSQGCLVPTTVGAHHLTTGTAVMTSDYKVKFTTTDLD